VAFLAWNYFQVVQFANVISCFPQADLIFTDRSYKKEIDVTWLKSQWPNVRLIRHGDVDELDGVFDVVFYQSHFPLMEYFYQTKLVALQYGLAKDWHNYGAWRSLSDLNLMFGSWSVNNVTHYAPAIAVGNPKFDNWGDYSKKESLPVNTNSTSNAYKPTVLVMLTWGETDKTQLINALIDLKASFNIIIKLHHLDEIHKADFVKQLKNLDVGRVVSGHADQLSLLAKSDVVLSDYSGAIFDAVYAKIPVVLFRPKNIPVSIDKLRSLEFKQACKLGLLCDDSSKLMESINLAILSKSDLLIQVDSLRKKLFIDADGKQVASGVRIHELITQLSEDDWPEKTQAQKNVAVVVKNERILKRKLAAKRWYFPYYNAR